MSRTPSQSANASRARQAVDGVVYAVAVAAVVFVIGAAIGLLVGGGLVTAKYVMFVLGILLFGYATFQLRPDPPWDTTETEDGELKVTKNEPSGRVVGGRDETKFQAAVQRIPPLPWYSLPPNQRFSAAFKLFLASLATLAWSFVLETVFGVAA
ncbi:hypothetical protein M0R88_06660 [Halorussus gelatinilyticus]|uniref:Uncharacterized protein n=1 Tax=Halorussus gelatinilyticus TaxID=2937524 RepID=A0A8U0IKV6_9EURY|nr:hypothetical protein [Halorussus gelatinilyticus]UPW01777.1 hypothetical protein M0R88_06660 [Halorussus gelatinilyticus]